MRIDGGPAPDDSRVAAIHAATDLSDLALAKTFASQAQGDLLALIDRLVAEARTSDLNECSSLLAHLSQSLAGLDPRHLEPRRGIAGWFDSRKRRLKTFRADYQTCARSMVEAASELIERGTGLDRRYRALDRLWQDVRAAILEVDAHIAAGLKRLSEQAQLAGAEEAGQHPLTARIAVLIALRTAAIKQLSLTRAAQNADCHIPAQTVAVNAAVLTWRDDWRHGLGLAGKRPRKIRPDLVGLYRERETLAQTLVTVEREIALSRTRRSETDARMARAAEAARRAAAC